MMVTYAKLSMVGICRSSIEAWCKANNVTMETLAKEGVDPNSDRFKNDNSLKKCYRLIRLKGIN